MTDMIPPNVKPLPDETWRPIPGFQNYFASSLGRIASKPRGSTTGGLLKQNISQPGRPRVSVAKFPGWPQTRARVSRLVTLAFHGPCPAGGEAAHHDGDTMNNVATNLFWRTA